MKKLITSIMAILISVLSMASYSYAEDLGQLEATIKIIPDVTEVSAGDKVTLTIKTVDISNSETGKISAIMGVIEYDENFFEYDSGLLIGPTGKFNSMTLVSEGGENGKITLKVKDNPTGTGVIKFTELVAGDGRLEETGSAETPDTEIVITLKTVEDEDKKDPPAEDEDKKDPPAEDEDKKDPPAEDEDKQDPPAEDEDKQDPPAEDEDKQDPPAEDEDKQDPPAGDEDKQDPPAGDKEEDKQDPPAGDEDKQDPPAEDKEDQKQPENTTTNKEEKDDTVANEEIPKAGLSTILSVGVIAVVISAIMIYIKNKKYQDIK